MREYIPLYCLLKKTEAEWYWDSGERFEMREEVEAFIAAECDAPETWLVVEIEDARRMAASGMVDDCADDIYPEV